MDGGADGPTKPPTPGALARSCCLRVWPCSTLECMPGQALRRRNHPRWAVAVIIPGPDATLVVQLAPGFRSPPPRLRNDRRSSRRPTPAAKQPSLSRGGSYGPWLPDPPRLQLRDPLAADQPGSGRGALGCPQAEPEDGRGASRPAGKAAPLPPGHESLRNLLMPTGPGPPRLPLQSFPRACCAWCSPWSLNSRVAGPCSSSLCPPRFATTLEVIAARASAAGVGRS